MSSLLYMLFASLVVLKTTLCHPHHHILHPNGTYHSKFEDLDLDLVLSSRRLIHNYVACLMDSKPCTAEGDELKRILPDAVKTGCTKCTIKQKHGTNKTIQIMKSKYPEDWDALMHKWDLTKLEYALKHEEFNHTNY